MAEQKPWVKALNINISDLEQWKLELPKEQSLTFWCLEKGKLKLYEYLKWAQNHYQLPILNTDYFTNSPDQGLWLNIQSVANWSAHMLPLAEWDGVIFIGCVEPHTDITWSFPVRYVLASPHDLKKRWQELQVEEETLEPPEGLQLAPLAQKTPIPEEEAPMGLLPSEPTSSESSEENSIPSNHDVFFQDDIPTGVYTPEELKNLEQQETLPPSPFPTDNHPSPEPEKPSTTSDLCAIDPDLAATDIEKAQSLDAAVAWLFKQARQHFSKSMLLTVDQTTLKAWKWDTLWQSSSQNTPFSLLEPSLFHVVYKTKLPYHGYIINTSINSAFFSQWGHKSLPAHATALPLLLDNNLFGILLCLGDQESNTYSILKYCEKIADLFTQAYIKLNHHPATSAPQAA